MVDKKISISEDVANLTTEAQLLFTWMIPQADDAGLLPYSTRSIKALVVPMKDWRVEDVGIHLESIAKAKLIEAFEWEGDKFWHITNFAQHQTLKKDRQPQTILKIRLSQSPEKNWKFLDSIWKPVGNQMETEVSKEVSKGSKEGVETNLKKLRDQWGTPKYKKP